MAETIESLKKEVAKLKKDVTTLKKDLAQAKKQKKAAKAKALAIKEEFAIMKAKMGYQPRAFEVLDNLTIAAETDRSSLDQCAAEARIFLDTLPADLQVSFRDWHPKVRGSTPSYPSR